MTLDYEVALDSNCVTYFLDAAEARFDPETDRTDLSDQRRCVVLLYFYAVSAYTGLPKVHEEVAAIQDPHKRRVHKQLLENLMLDVLEDLPVDARDRRVAALLDYHPKPADCRILAEAEMAAVPVLLTFDTDFRNRLGAVAAGTRILRPCEFWDELDIPPGTEPTKGPRPSNPMAGSEWWRI